ncbi:MAG: C40 family peptidase [Negativicutes bacterium]|nr:C40 family peptidase [Negativicutes bacterium]
MGGKKLKLRNLAVAVVAAVMMFLAIPYASAQPASPDMPVKRGMYGDEVSKLQNKLKEYGYYKDPVDGRFGANTLSAVVQFQMDAGLTADGIVGLSTWESLKNFRGASSISRGRGNSRKAQILLSMARQYVGVPYVWAGRSPSGFDCSGFIYYVFDQLGYGLPRMADGQFEVGIPVSRNSLEPGDLVFFETYEPGPSHVGIYIGNDQFIHASSGAGHVTVTPLNKTYYRDRYLGARRILK